MLRLARTNPRRSRHVVENPLGTTGIALAVVGLAAAGGAAWYFTAGPGASGGGSSSGGSSEGAAADSTAESADQKKKIAELVGKVDNPTLQYKDGTKKIVTRAVANDLVAQGKFYRGNATGTLYVEGVRTGTTGAGIKMTGSPKKKKK